MLLSLSIENVRSFKAEQTLNLIASRRLDNPADSPHGIQIPGTDESALRVAAVYGPNGAGKSNLVRALTFIAQMVRRGTQPRQGIPFKPFMLDRETESQPGCIDLRFLAGDRVFRYGFCLDREQVHEEWLSVYTGTKERPVFTRTADGNGTATVEIGRAVKDVDIPDKMKALAKVGARHNQLFLAEVVNVDDPAAQGGCFRTVIEWFQSTLHVVPAGASFAMLAETLAADEEFADFAGRFLAEAGTGIGALEVHTETMPASKVAALSAGDLKEAFDNLAAGQALVLSGPDGEELFIDGDRKDTVKVRRIRALHDGTPAGTRPLPFQEESDGSRRLLNLLPALHVLKKQGGVFVIDELERSMHPVLARKFMDFFLKVGRGNRSQVIFTTHESTLLDLDIMRRDGIWFTEKNKEGATALYSLAEFNVRKDLRIGKGYLQGRFGAIPFLGGVDRLIEEERIAEGAV